MLRIKLKYSIMSRIKSIFGDFGDYNNQKMQLLLQDAVQAVR